ncbi:hypothetical protein CC80DRAFT_498332 [Byssothecium circinans]|uniref:Uncharacterized protein n=1 Tax=Byssothecium circinans TaxID=147558 RepID=A0A6A5T6R7_9PLEO|nr:hypothetical protein CC80DRAFT_498332 [Byssothecium circinans]
MPTIAACSAFAPAFDSSDDLSSLLSSPPSTMQPSSPLSDAPSSPLNRLIPVLSSQTAPEPVEGSRPGPSVRGVRLSREQKLEAMVRALQGVK